MRQVQPIWGAFRNSSLLRMGAGPEVVARHATGGLVYLASPVTCRFEAGAQHGGKLDDWLTLDVLLHECGLDLAALAEAGVTAVSPVVLSLSMVRARGDSLRLDPWGVLDAARWQGWCWPLLARCSAVYVPARSGWWASAGIAAEVHEALGRNCQVFVQAGQLPAMAADEGAA